MNKQKQVRSVLVTGGEGFIGYNLSKRLAEKNFEVTVIDSENPMSGFNPLHRTNLEKQNVRIIKDTIGNISKHEQSVKKCDAVINCAALISHLDSMKNPISDIENNTIEQIKFVDFMKQYPQKRIIYTSTRQVYGKQEKFPVKESAPINPVDSNGINKYTTELYYSLYSNIYSLNSLVLRLTNIYGPGMHIRDKRLSFIGWFINRCVTNNPIELYGEGSQKRDMLYIDDLCDTLISSLNSDYRGTVNVGSDTSSSLMEIALLIKRNNPRISILNVNFPEEIKKIDIGDFSTDNTLAKKLFNHKETVNLEEGLKKTIDYYNKNKGYYL
ncbi:MAG: NAD-dependent epimerase/dehydratase family protein [bacterium]|nr:NAD-dependent epimerase/dehydratase family protein [bacterium]